MITKEAIEAGVAAFESAFNGSPNSTEMVTTILTAAFAAMPGPSVNVKPLEWRDGKDERTVFSVVQVAIILGANNLFGLNYLVLGSDRHGLYEVVLGDKIIKTCGSEEAAKAAAQADYEARILSALTPAPYLAAENERLRAALHAKAEKVGPLTIGEIDDVFAALERKP